MIDVYYFDRVTLNTFLNKKTIEWAVPLQAIAYQQITSPSSCHCQIPTARRLLSLWVHRSQVSPSVSTCGMTSMWSSSTKKIISSILPVQSKVLPTTLGTTSSKSSLKTLSLVTRASSNSFRAGSLTSHETPILLKFNNLTAGEPRPATMP